MATILEGLNQIAEKLGGTANAGDNLEALNAISAALGGPSEAENNADAIANIAENASSGGGSGTSDFSTATVTVKLDIQNVVEMEAPYNIIGNGDSDTAPALRYDDTGFTGNQYAPIMLSSGTQEFHTIFVGDYYLVYFDVGYNNSSWSVSGNAEIVEMEEGGQPYNAIKVTGDYAITITNTDQPAMI